MKSGIICAKPIYQPDIVIKNFLARVMHRVLTFEGGNCVQRNNTRPTRVRDVTVSIFAEYRELSDRVNL